MIKICIYTLSILVFSQQLSWANSCMIYLNDTSLDDKPESNPSLSNTQSETMLNRIDQAVAELESQTDLAPTLDEIKKLKSPSATMTVLKKIYESKINLNRVVWMTLEQRIFVSNDIITPEFINVKAGPVFERYYAHFDQFDLEELFKNTRKGEFQARKRLALALKKIERIAEIFFGEPVDLFSDTGWKIFFQIENISDVSNKLRIIGDRFFEINDLVTKVWVREESADSIASYYENFFFGSSRRRAKEDINQSSSRINIEETMGLIKALGLTSDKEEHYLKKAKILNSDSNRDSIRIKFAAIFNLFKAYLEKFEDIPGITDLPISQRALSIKQLIHVKQRIHSSRIVSAIMNTLFEEYLNQADQINERIASLKNQVKSMTSKFPGLRDELIDLEVEISSLKEVQDFDENLIPMETTLKKLEVKIDALNELGLKQVRNENITNFEDLNFRWQRLIAGKKYNINGADYKHFIFEKDVVDFFQTHPIDGARFLSAASKGYVATKGQSGLRRLPSLHPDFRDIKVITNSFGKIRIVGKLKGNTIHFFYIYHSEKSYDHDRIRPIVDHF